MPRLVSISRAARLVGIPRGTLQKQIQAGDILSFEGKIRLSDLAEAYPSVSLEDNSMLEKIDQIIERARHKARSRKEVPPDMDVLAARINILSDELVDARMEVNIYSNIIDKLKTKIKNIGNQIPQAYQAASDLHLWLLHEVESIAATKARQHPLLATDAFLRIMAAQVHLQPGGQEFFVEGNNSILESGLSAGLALNYGCSNGNCGKCKARLLAGEVKKIRPHDYVLSEAEKLQNTILTCSYTAVSDVTLEADIAGSENDIPEQTISARVKKLSAANQHISVLNIKTPRTQRLRFLAGQYVTLAIPEVASRDMFIASCPCDDMNLQFHIEKSEDDFSRHIFTALKNNDPITLTGPHGHFVLANDITVPIIFIAYAGGFAPIKSVIEHAMTLDISESLHLYWIVAEENELYLHNQCRAWADALENFHYSPVIAADTNWQQATENVLQDITQQYTKLSSLQYYLAGPEEMLQANLARLQTQIPRDNLHSQIL